MIHQKNRQDCVQSAVEMYYEDVYRFCRYYTGNSTDSYDITQEVFLRYMKYMDSCGHKNLKAYLMMIARNLCCDYFRRQSEQREKLLSFDMLEDTAEGGCLGAVRTIDNCDSELYLQELLQSISQEQREVVILRIHDGLKFHEIAKITGCRLSTVKSRFRLGIASIKKKIGGNYA
ncbi:MAG: RNA polymerase sigma factor [Lachnospiraceae bacterium]|nr:RNA polymerase sigma factor [Lachnospiraceae bacterium]